MEKGVSQQSTLEKEGAGTIPNSRYKSGGHQTEGNRPDKSVLQTPFMMTVREFSKGEVVGWTRASTVHSMFSFPV